MIRRAVRYLYWRLVLQRPRIQRRLLDWTLPGGPIFVDVFGAHLSIRPRREPGYYRLARLIPRVTVLRDEVPTLLSLALLLQAGDTFIDIGANVGLYSVLLARVSQAHPDIRFYAFEPQADTAAQLRAAAADLVHVHQVALSDEASTLDFFEGATSLVFGAVAGEGIFQDRSKSVAVAAQRLDALDIPGDNMFLKIDVEGHEMEVLRGARGLFDAGRVRVVYLDGYKDAAVVTFLSERDFDFFDGRTMRPGVAGRQLLAVRAGNGARRKPSVQ